MYAHTATETDIPFRTYDGGTLTATLYRPAAPAIAAVVERSFFGGRPVDEAGYAACRQAYTAFALPGAWA